jgi:non-specific serine/threonine protein kinase
MTAAAVVGSSGFLPAELTTFIGRRGEVAEVRRLLSSGRLVTLTGPGGVGKTRLAQRVCLDMRRAVPDGVWFVTLAELHDPTLLTVTVAEALGIREQSINPGAPVLAAYLARKRAILVLDNCEQIVDACADLVGTLLRACPELRILATSRQILRVSGEIDFAVRPLVVPGPEATAPAALARVESAALLFERASAVRPFVLTEDNSEAFAKLCQALEGIPLAIELAAARLRVLSLDQILDRLTDRYHLLTSGNRDVPARQRTLRALIDWSWDLCTEAEQTLWARLSVFAGGLDLDAAEAVCADEDLPASMILDLVASLVDKSVLMRIGDGHRVRFTMLEVIREYGASRLAQRGEEGDLRRRHCRWFARMAEQGDADWVSARQPDIIRGLRTNHANLRVALEFATVEGPPELALQFAADLSMHWFVQGFLPEGRHWLDRALALPSNRHPVRVKALWVAAWIAVVQGDLARGEALLVDAQQLGDLSSPADPAYMAIVEGNIAMLVEDERKALQLFEEALVLARAVGSRAAEIWTLAALGLARGLQGEPSTGVADLIACRDMAAASGDLWWRSYALWGLAVLRWRAGDIAEATEAAKESLEIIQQVQDEQFGVGLSLEALAWIAATEHDDQRAAQLLGASGRLWRSMRASLVAFRSLRTFHEQSVQRVRERLGDKAFKAAARRGATLPTTEVIELALERNSAPPPAPPQPAALPELTRREGEVATLIAQGLSNRDIAARLSIAQRTAESHVENIMVKLGFTSRAQIAAWQVVRNPQ